MTCLHSSSQQWGMWSFKQPVSNAVCVVMIHQSTDGDSKKKWNDEVVVVGDSDDNDDSTEVSDDEYPLKIGRITWQRV